MVVMTWTCDIFDFDNSTGILSNATAFVKYLLVQILPMVIEFSS